MAGGLKPGAELGLLTQATLYSYFPKRECCWASVYSSHWGLCLLFLLVGRNILLNACVKNCMHKSPASSHADIGVTY